MSNTEDLSITSPEVLNLITAELGGSIDGWDVIPVGGTRPVTARPFIFLDVDDFNAQSQPGDVLLATDGAETALRAWAGPNELTDVDMTDATPSVISTATIPAAQVEVGDVLEVRAAITVANGGASKSVVFRLVHGPTTLIASEAETVSATGNPLTFVFEFSVSVRASDVMTIGSITGGPAAPDGEMRDINTNRSPIGFGTATPDFSTTRNLELTIESDTVASLIVTGQMMVVRHLKAS